MNWSGWLVDRLNKSKGVAYFMLDDCCWCHVVFPGVLWSSLWRV